MSLGALHLPGAGRVSPDSQVTTLIENAKYWSFNYCEHGLCPSGSLHPRLTPPTASICRPPLSLSLTVQLIVSGGTRPEGPASTPPHTHTQRTPRTETWGGFPWTTRAQGQDTGGHKSVASPSIPRPPLPPSRSSTHPPTLSTTHTHTHTHTSS